MLQQNMHPHKTTDQTVKMSRTTQFPFVRVYYGESEEDQSDKLLDEINYADAFAYEETEDDKTYAECMGTMEDMGIEDFLEKDERCKTFGFDKKLDMELKREKKQGQCKNCFTKRRLSEFVKQNVDEMIFSKKAKEKEFVKKNKLDDSENSVMSRLLIRNIEAIKRLAEKENIKIENKKARIFSSLF